ncbi:MAG: ATP-binding protein [Gemmataceae bacterium]
MASRWRIRHKLLLGLGLVVVILALLLLGTSRALWGNFLTMTGIRVRLAELLAAEELNRAASELVGLENVHELIERPRQLPAELKKVRAAVDTYAAQLDETLAAHGDPSGGIYEKAQVELVRERLDAFALAVDARVRQPGVGTSPAELKERHLKAMEPASKALLDSVTDLREHLKKELEKRLGESRRHYQVALWIIIPSSAVGLIVMAGLMRSFYAWVFTPIRDLEQGVGRVARGDLAHRIELHSGDEMEDLARAFNGMLGRLCELYDDLNQRVDERSRQLVRSERLASVGFLAAGVAHEINNPLASIAFCGEALEARLNELMLAVRSTGRAREEHEVFSKYLRMIQEEAFRCKHITERLLEFSRTGEPKREPADLRGLVQAVLDVTQHLPNHKGKQIVFETPRDAPAGRVTAWVNGEEIKSVILNLVVNALESMDEGGRLVIQLARRDGRAELRFTDNGVGMSREVLDNIFEPFFTRSRTGKGTGLGLTISHLVITQHGGEIEATSPGVGLGSTFTVRLPVGPVEPAKVLTIGQPAAARAA